MRVDPYRLLLLIVAGALLGASPAVAVPAGGEGPSVCKPGDSAVTCCNKKLYACNIACDKRHKAQWLREQCRKDCLAAWRKCKPALEAPADGAAGPELRPDGGARRDSAPTGGPTLQGPRLICCKVVRLQSRGTAYEWKPANECRHDSIAGISRTIVSSSWCAAIRGE